MDVYSIDRGRKTHSENTIVKLGKSAILAVSALLISSITLIAFYIYCLLLMVTVLIDGEWILLPLYVLFVFVFYFVFRNMRIGKTAIYVSLAISGILLIYCKYYDLCKNYLNITVFQDIGIVIKGIFAFTSQLEIKTGFIQKAIDIFGLKELIVLSIIVMASYVYLLNYLEKRPVSVHNIDKGEGKLNEFTFSAVTLYEAFNLFIFFTLFSYLISLPPDFNRLIELSIISGMLFITYLLFKNVVNTARDITSDYDNITELNEKNPIELIIRKFANGAGMLKEKFAGIYSVVIPDLNYYIDLVPFYPRVTKAVVRTLPLAAFILGFLGYVLQFNILSLLYIELTLLGWYSLMCISLNIPSKKVDIVLANGQPVNNVYIIDELSQEFLLVINAKNVQIKIMKGSISTIISPSHADQKNCEGSQSGNTSSQIEIKVPA